MRATSTPWSSLIDRKLGTTEEGRLRSLIPAGHGPSYLGDVWIYTLVDYDPERDGPEEEWGKKLAAQGWQMWDAGHGPWVDINGRRVKRWSLRRWVGPQEESRADGRR
jgi:hypothetical protein